MDSAAHTVAMLLADARLPSGGHAFSAGVEPAIQGGLARGDVGAFLRARARTTTLVDAATAVVARRAGLIGASYAPIEQAWAARTPSRAARVASIELGRGLLRLAQRLWPQSPAIAALTAAEPLAAPPHRARAVAAHTGLDAETLVRVAVYDDMAGASRPCSSSNPATPSTACGS